MRRRDPQLGVASLSLAQVYVESGNLVLRTRIRQANYGTKLYNCERTRRGCGPVPIWPRHGRHSGRRRVWGVMWGLVMVDVGAEAPSPVQVAIGCACSNLTQPLTPPPLLPSSSSSPSWTFGCAVTSGWVDTGGKVAQLYGRFDVRAKLPNPNATSIWPAHWMMPNSSVCWPSESRLSVASGSGEGEGVCVVRRLCAHTCACPLCAVGGELDIMEMVGGLHNSSVMGTYHWSESQCYVDDWDKRNANFPPLNSSTSIDFSADYHVFSATWTPYQLEWFVDGNLYYHRDVAQPWSLFIPNTPMYLILNTALAW